MRVIETDHAEPRELNPCPNYRVNFWERRNPKSSWSLNAYVLFDVSDAKEVLNWAEQHAAGRPYEILVEVEEEEVHALATPRTAALVRLFGENPNSPGSTNFG